MKFVSKYRKLRVVLYPTRKIFHKEGANDEVQVIPPIVAEFEGGMFDTTKSFPAMHIAQENAGKGDRLATEDQLIHLLKANPSFNRDFFEYTEESAAHKISRIKANAEELARQYGMSYEDVVAMLSGKTGKPDKSPSEPIKDPTPPADTHTPGSDTTGKPVIPSKEKIEIMPWPEQQALAQSLGLRSVGVSKINLLQSIEDVRAQAQS